MLMQYWTIDVSKKTPPAFLLELACLHPREKEHLLFRDRFNALKAARILGTIAYPIHLAPGEKP
jgi:hypothetical protein